MTEQPTADGALNLVWCDLEFTHLDLERTRILQAAMLVTDAELRPIPVPAGALGKDAKAEGGGLDLLVRITPDEASLASDWVKEHQGELLERSQRDPSALELAEVERRMLAYLRATCGGEPEANPRLRPLLAGSSVHKDYSVLERFMPTLIGHVSYRLIDVSCLKELGRRWYDDVPAFDKERQARALLPEFDLAGSEHDALYDIKCSLAELRYYRQHLFR